MKVEGGLCSMKASTSCKLKFLIPWAIFAALAVVPFALIPPAEPLDMLPPQSDYDRCIDKSGGITSNMMDCNGLEQQRLDALLDEAYRKAMATLPPDEKKQLAISQIKWDEKIDISCQNDPSVKEFEGGSYAGVIYSICIQEETESRILELEYKYLSPSENFQ